ncbi:hypothetical protein BGZ76_003845 [Entomortierella beljakovae]|nr:hypothetical protein BGZ76_003845 [Entomortierella beljakovae]
MDHLPGGKVHDATIRLNQLMLGPGIFHVLVFTADMLSINVGPVSQGSIRQGIELTDEEKLKKNIDHYIHEWRSKREYGSRFFHDEKKRSLINVYVIGALPEKISGPTFHDSSNIQADSLRYGVPIKSGSDAIIVVRPDSHYG